MSTRRAVDSRAAAGRPRAGVGRRCLLVVLTTGALAAAACGSTGTHTPTPTPTPTDAATSSPTPDASDTAVLAAYQAYMSAANQAFAATSGTGAWNLPVLSATMVDPLLQQWKNQLLQQEAQGIMVEGRFTPEHPSVVSNTGTTSVVSDCVWDTTVQYYRAPNGGTPEPVPNQPGGTQPGGDGYRLTLTLLSDKWMASAIASLEYGNCTGY